MRSSKQGLLGAFTKLVDSGKDHTFAGAPVRAVRLLALKKQAPMHYQGPLSKVLLESRHGV